MNISPIGTNEYEFTISIPAETCIHHQISHVASFSKNKFLASHCMVTAAFSWFRKCELPNAVSHSISLWLTSLFDILSPYIMLLMRANFQIDKLSIRYSSNLVCSYNPRTAVGAAMTMHHESSHNLWCQHPFSTFEYDFLIKMQCARKMKH